MSLKGQAELTETKDESPIPFIEMNKEQILVYKTVCPNSSPIEHFSGEAIPLKCLRSIKFCYDQEYFKSIYIWSSHDKKDPVVIGCPKEEYQSKFLICRWGYELLPYEEMKILAIKIMKEKFISKLKSFKQTADALLQDMDNTVQLYISEQIDYHIKNILER
jgi:hypothetical protein